MSDINLAIDTLVARQRHYDYSESYYEGTAPEVFASAKWSLLFGRTNQKNDHRLNFARTVVEAVQNRLELATIQGSTLKATKLINEMFEENELALEQGEIHRRALTFGECYAVVWPDEDGDVSINYNSPKNAVIVYDAENPRKKLFAAKTWVEGSGTGYNLFQQPTQRTRLNLYYADRIEKYYREGSMLVNEGYGFNGDVAAIGGQASATWIPLSVEENPFGEIPMFHFRTQRPYGRPEHQDAWSAQDMINKLVANHMTTIDYQGAPQRYALTAAGADSEADAFDDGDSDRENLDSLRNGPGELWYLKGVNSVGQFNPADYSQFTEPILKYVIAMASITETPMHYFANSGRVPSGEALRVSEAPLMKKVASRQASFGKTWKEIFSFGLKIEGIENAEVTVRWKNMESMDSVDNWTVAGMKKTVGLGVEQILLEMGYDTELAKTLADEAAANVQALPMGQNGYNTHNALLAQQAAEAHAASNTDSNVNNLNDPAPDSAN